MEVEHRPNAAAKASVSAAVDLGVGRGGLGRVLWVAFATRLRAMLASPSQLVFTSLFYFLVTAVLSGLWRVAVQGAGGSIVGYDATAIVWYIAATEISIMALPPRVIEVEADEIISGRIEVDLIRPADVLPIRIAQWMGHALPKVICCLAVALAWGLYFGGAPPSTAALLLAGPAVLLAILNNVVAQVAVGGGAFWLRDVRAFWFLYQKLVFVLGGMLLPLEVLPGWLEGVAVRLPFMTMAYAPGRLASGHLELELIGWQLFWLVVLLVGAIVVFRRGIDYLVRQP